MKFSYALLASIALALLANNAFGQAVVAEVSGPAAALKDGVSRTLAVSAKVDAGSTVSCGAQCRLILQFPDGSVVTLASNSSMRIEQYRYDTSNPRNSTSLLSLVTGGLRWVSGAMAKADQRSTKIVTRTATIGIRGTVVGSVDLGGDVFVEVELGQIEAINGFGNVVVDAGQVAAVGMGGAPGLIAAGSVPGNVANVFTQINPNGVISTQAKSLASQSGPSTQGPTGGGATGGGATGAATGGATIGGLSLPLAGGLAAGAAAVGVAVRQQRNNNTASGS
jgi:hypothetical protein